MKYEVAHVDGKVYVTFRDAMMVRKFIDVVEDTIKSNIFNNNYSAAREQIDFLLALTAAYREMRDSEKNEEPNGTRL